MDSKEYDQYLIYDFFNIVYKVYVNKNKDIVYVYKKRGKHSNLFLTIKNPISVFISKDYLNFSEGKTILINVSHNRYLFIGSEIYSFVSNDKIINLYCNTLRHNISFPIVEGEKYLYFMYDFKIVPKKLMKTTSEIETSKLYSSFYNLPKHIKSILKYFHSVIHYKN
jgi:hypothetical protein